MSREKRSHVRSYTIAAAVMVLLACLQTVRSDHRNAKVPGPEVVDFIIENRGSIRVELLSAAAPKTVAHFLSLVDRGFYDRILFHRLEAKFVAQAGDPDSRKVDGQKLATISPNDAAQIYHLGLGGSGKTVPLEATLPLIRGSLGLARGSDTNSGDSQFFFNLSDNHRLDNQYTVFGKVIRGLDVMDKIHQGDRIKSIRRIRADRMRRPK